MAIVTSMSFFSSNFQKNWLPEITPALLISTSMPENPGKDLVAKATSLIDSNWLRSTTVPATFAPLFFSRLTVSRSWLSWMSHRMICLAFS